MIRFNLPKNFEKNFDSNIDIDKFKYMLDSMTPEGRHNPEIINSSRIKRIARGPGVKEEEVREFLRSYRQVKNMIKKFSMRSFKRGILKNLLKVLESDIQSNFISNELNSHSMALLQQ